MADKPSLGAIQLLRRLKAKLISILSEQADFVLQHADSSLLVTFQGYRQIKSCRIPDEKMRDLLDHIIDRGPAAAEGLLELLKNQELQEAFPLLNFIKSIQVGSADSGEQNKSRRKMSRKQKRKPEIHEEVVPTKKSFSPREQNKSRRKMSRKHKRKPEIHEEVVPTKKSFSPMLVTEKQLMTAARAMGQSWREVAIMALEVPSVKLEQIVADNPNCQVNQTFAALRYWRNIQGNKATASYLHSLLSQPDLALSQEAFNFLLEKN